MFSTRDLISPLVNRVTYFMIKEKRNRKTRKTYVSHSKRAIEYFFRKWMGYDFGKWMGYNNQILSHVHL